MKANDQRSAENLSSKSVLEKGRPPNGQPESADNPDEDLDLPVPPDGGWGWIVVIGSFLVHVLADGVVYAFGVYLVEFVSYFNAGRGEIGWVGSLVVAVTFIVGPISSALTNKYGCRAVTIAGAVITAVGFVISIFAPNVVFLYFSIGVVAGIGLGLIYLPAIVCVGYYFEKRRAFATGLAACGSGIGTFAFAPFSKWLLDLYGWKGSLLIQAGLILNCCICGAVFRPLHVVQKKSSLKTAENGKVNGKIAKEVLNTPADNHYGSLEKIASPMYRKDILYTGSLSEIAAYKHDRAAYISSVTSIPSPDENKTSNVPRCLRCSGELKDAFKDMTDFGLLKDPVFVMIAVSNLFTSIGYNAPYIFIPDRSIQQGIDEERAALLISVLGIANTVGRVAFGWLSDRKCINRLWVYCTALTLCGISTAMSSLCLTYPLMMTYSAAYGFFIAAYVCLTPVILADLFGLEKLSNAFGLILLFQGVATLIGPPICGWVFDGTGSYDASFWIAGSMIALSGFMLFFIPCMRRCCKCARQTRNSDVLHGEAYSVVRTNA